ncbi:MAG: UDP-3-O-acylglucosamine N-acyltransferase [Pirellulaceae bacterium]|nr:MAG: UDP-3-O-acylglucosamine N-acyltransferase [Pirellulaceae bacterium]
MDKAMRLSEIAARCRASWQGSDDPFIRSVCALQDAEPDCLTLIDHPHKLGELDTSPAAAAVAPTGIASSSKPLIITDNPHEVFQAALLMFRQAPVERLEGIHPTAVISPSATVGPGTVVGPGVTIGEDVVIGSNCCIHAGCHLQSRSALGDECQLMPNVVLYPGTRLGNRVILHAGVVLGAHGFGYRTENGVHHLSAQLGWVEIDDDVEIGANTTVDRGTYGPTRIGAGTKIDNQVQIGHNCRIGRHNLICAHVGFAGSCRTGDYVILAGQVGVADHVTIEDRVTVGARSGIMRDVASGEVVLGAPALPIKQAMQINALMAKLPELRQTVRKLEREVKELQGRSGESRGGATREAA